MFTPDSEPFSSSYEVIVGPGLNGPAEDSALHGKFGVIYLYMSLDHPLISTSVAFVSALSRKACRQAGAS